jgi:hypothetical protein
MDATNRETKFQELIYAQNFIGWDHLLKGRLSQSLVLANANSYISTLTPTPTQRSNPANNGG